MISYTAEKSKSESMLREALSIARVVGPVFPCTGKKPLTPHGCKDASRDEATIREWWARNPSANVAVATGNGLLVVDIDGECALPSALSDLPRTVTVQTSRGRHLYLRTDGAQIGNRTKIDGLPIDVRGDGGYAIAPPSVHPDTGTAYEWLAEPWDCDIAYAPPELLDWLTKPKHPTAAPAPTRRTTGTAENKMTRAHAYADKIPHAIQGANGSGQLMAFLRQVVEGFALDDAETQEIVAVYNGRCVPPWSEAEIEHALASIRKQPNDKPRGWLLTEAQPAYTTPARTGGDTQPTSTDQTDDEPQCLTDIGNAQRYAHDHGENVRYCHPWHKWLIWDGTRWRIDDAGQDVSKAKQSILRLYGWAQRQIALLARDGSPDARAATERIQAVLDHALKSQNVNRISAMLSLAQSEPGIPIAPDALDADPWALNVMNGTIDLRTGNLRPHRQDDYLTHRAPVAYDPAATCPTWDKFVSEIFSNSREMVEYMQRLIGLWLTGATTEHALPVLWGSGANGKSTLVNTLFAMLGEDYAGKAPRDLLTAVKGDRHPTAMAWLHGKRFVAAIETGQAAKLDEALVKELTGGDQINARRMREDFWQFTPTHKLAMVTNHRPIIVGTDGGIWRRLRLVPFTVTFEEAKQDKDLPTKLRAEMPGILAWAVRGCLEWQRNGLADPPAVMAATAEYRTAEDRLGEFLSTRCRLNPEFRAKLTDTYAAYRTWCDAENEKQMSAKAFGLALSERGIQRDPGKRWYTGLALLEEED